MRAKTESGNVVSSHSSACGAQLLHHEGVDRLAQRLVLLGEDEVAPRGGVIGLLDFGRGHSGNLRAAVRVDTQMSFATVQLRRRRQRRRHDRPRPPRGAQRALGRSCSTICWPRSPQARDDDAVRCVVLTSTHEKVFSAGGDLGGFAAEAPLVHKFFATDRFPRLFHAIGGLGKPTLCAANGHVLAGALGLALACDLIIAKEGARFGTPEINVGIFPFMIMALIYRNVGRKKTNELLLLGEQIDAHEAERIGIVNKVVPADEFDAAVADWAGRLAAKSPLLMRLGKDAMHRQQDLALADAIEYLHAQLHARALDRRHPGGRARPSSRSGSRCGPAAERRRAALPDLRPHGGRRARRRGAGARAGPRRAADRRRPASRGSPPYDDDLRDSHGCLLEAGGQVDDMLDRRAASRC